MVGRERTVDATLRQQAVETLAALLVRMLRLDAPVTEQTKLVDELDLGSARVMELLIEVENELAITIDVDELDIEDTSTMGELADYVVGHATPEGA